MLDPIHVPDDERSDVLWSIANTSEAFPGTVTPLTWTFVDHGMELGTRQAFFDLGALSRSEVEVPQRYDQRVTAIFHGKVSANLDYMRQIMDRVPGMSGDKLEEAIAGSVRPGVSSTREIRRYPFVVAKLPAAFRTVPKRARALRAETQRWWQDSLAGVDRLDEAQLRALFGDARRRFGLILRPNSTAGFIGPTIFGLGYQLCAGVDRMDLANGVVSGFGRVEETDVAGDLWRTARGELTLDDFIAEHGYHGPREGELRSSSWRENSDPVERLLEEYANLGPADVPSARLATQTAHRAAIAELRAATPAHKRWLIDVYDRLANTWVPLREVTKAAYIQTMDVGRACARRLGAVMAADGRLDDAEDVFFLTADELERGRPVSPEEIGFRRGRWADHERIELPERWVGIPDVAPTVPGRRAAVGERITELVGYGASPGVIEARARVIDDPSTADIEPDEVLVCTVTDPSWVSLIVVAAAIVADIGGPMSHAAIISRELGVPCVIATKHGTTVLRTGDLLRVDGTAGTVTVLEPAPPTDAETALSNERSISA